MAKKGCIGKREVAKWSDYLCVCSLIKCMYVIHFFFKWTISGIYGAMALAGKFICSITGIDCMGGFNPSLDAILEGLGYAAPPIMALLFILDVSWSFADLLLKTWTMAFYFLFPFPKKEKSCYLVWR